MKDYLYKIKFLSIDSTKAYNEIKNEMLDCLREKNIIRPLVRFNDEKKVIYVGYNKYEIKNIFEKSFISYDKFFKGSIINGIMLSNSRFFEENIKKLDKESEEFFKANDITYQKKKIPSKISNYTPSQIAANLLKTFDGICIGESHEALSSKSFIIDNMEVLKANGVSTIFLEHLLDDHHTKELKEFFNSPENTKMPFRLKLYLEALDTGHNTDKTYSFENLVKEAKKYQIEIVAFDTNASYFTFDPDKLLNERELKNRYRKMNYLAAKKINSFNKKGKWIALIGSAHLTKNLGIPGVCELTNTPSIVIEDTKKGYNVNVANGKVKYLNSETRPDIIISMQTTNKEILKLLERLTKTHANNLER